LLQINVNKNFQKHYWCFISWLVDSLFYSWQSYSLTTQPQKFSNSAYIFRNLARLFGYKKLGYFIDFLAEQ
jgi:hypothetical protein